MFDLVKSGAADLITDYDSSYAPMLEKIQNNLPVIQEGCRQFGKAQSQFMDNFMTVSHPTPLRNCRQILAEMNKLFEALKEAKYNIEKKKIQIRKLKKERNVYALSDDLKNEELDLEISLLTSQIETTMLYVQGAVRSIANYNSQYEIILKNAGYEKLTEEAFEAEEEAYHISKAFEQALCAARARGGLVDEGNHLYFMQIGINGKMAELFIQRFFKQEIEEINKGINPGHEFLNDFLNHMRQEFKGCSKSVALKKGNLPLTEEALLRSK